MAAGAGEDVLRGGQQRRSGVGRRHTAPVVREQLDGQHPFECPDLPAEPGLGNVQPLRRAAEMQLFGDHDEIAQMPQFHARPG